MRLLTFILLALLLASCVDYRKLLEERKGQAYHIDRAAYGDKTVIRTYGYYHFYVIDYTRIAQLRPGENLQIRGIAQCFESRCTGYVNGNYDRPIQVQVLFGTDDRYAAHSYFSAKTGAPKGASL